MWIYIVPPPIYTWIELQSYYNNPHEHGLIVQITCNLVHHTFTNFRRTNNSHMQNDNITLAEQHYGWN
jgi:hypothetical protein